MVKSFSVSDSTMSKINELSKALQKKQSEIISEAIDIYHYEAIDIYHYAKINQRFAEMESQPQEVVGEAVPETNDL